jgi:hypothetical protein
MSGLGDQPCGNAPVPAARRGCAANTSFHHAGRSRSFSSSGRLHRVGDVLNLDDENPARNVNGQAPRFEHVMV